MKAEDIERRVEWVAGTVQFQQLNGLVTDAQAMEINAKLFEAESKLSLASPDLPAANHAARDARVLLFKAINSTENSWWKKFVFLYGGPAWVVIAVTALLLILLQLTHVLKFTLITFLSGQTTVDVTADILVWGGLGGCASAVYFLRQSIYEMQLSAAYEIYYAVYPLAGAIFGTAIALTLAGGLLVVQAGAASYSLFAAASFLAGLLQEWAVKTFRDIAEGIHKTS